MQGHAEHMFFLGCRLQRAVMASVLLLLPTQHSPSLRRDCPLWFLPLRYKFCSLLVGIALFSIFQRASRLFEVGKEDLEVV